MFKELGRLDEIAGGQWSLVTRAQLVDAGISKAQIITLLRAHVLRPVRRGVYAFVGAPRSWQQRAYAAVLSAGEGAVASHATAARLWGFMYLPAESIDVTVESDIQPGMKGVRRTTILPEEDVTERSGIPCTSFERTLCDCTTILSQFQLGRVLDDGLRRKVVSLAALTRCVFRLDSGPRRRLSVIQDLLSQRDASFNPGGSTSELRILAVFREAGIPAPVQQFPVRVDSHPYELDFAWPELRVFAEYYGLAVHSGVSAVAHDNERLTAMVGQDWRPLVFTDTTPDREIVKRTKQALALAARDRRFDAA
jgi:hypothetical protein